ncbi:hypothetical protein [Streptacidiphilus sp. MAP5-3]|uniref:hypothetical protein n=1 Tax=unclassified Streptacidiphilus TaxID=2643834 RepID=UPI003515342C
MSDQPQEPPPPPQNAQPPWPQQPQWQQPPPQWQQAPAGAQGVAGKKPRNKWKIGCLGCGGLALLVGIIVVIVIVTSVNKAVNKTVKVDYKVTGTAKDVTILYSNWQSDSWSSSTSTVPTLPWSKQVTSSGLVKGGDLTVTTGADGGTVTCSVTVDNGTPKTGSASGAFATASCSGFGS